MRILIPGFNSSPGDSNVVLGLKTRFSQTRRFSWMWQAKFQHGPQDFLSLMHNTLLLSVDGTSIYDGVLFHE